MKIYLNVKYEQKESVKRIGALWDHVLKLWYIESRNVDVSKFKNYMRVPDHLLKPHEPTAYEIESLETIKRLTKSEKRKLNKKKTNAIKHKESLRNRRANVS